MIPHRNRVCFEIEIVLVKIISKKSCVGEKNTNLMFICYITSSTWWVRLYHARGILLTALKTHSVKRERRCNRTEAKRQFEKIHRKYISISSLKIHKCGWNGSLMKGKLFEVTMDTVQLWKLYGCGWATFWIWTTCWLCGWSCVVVNCS